MQKFWFLSSIWFRNVSWCDAIKTSMCSKRNVVLSNVYTAINNYLSAKQGFEGASFLARRIFANYCKNHKTTSVSWMCIREKSWNKHFPFISKKKYIFVLSISAARYTSTTLLLTHYKSSIIWSKLFMSFTTTIDFFLSWLLFFFLKENHKIKMFFNKEYGTFEHCFFIPFIIVVGTARL